MKIKTSIFYLFFFTNQIFSFFSYIHIQGKEDIDIHICLYSLYSLYLNGKFSIFKGGKAIYSAMDTERHLRNS